MQAVYVYVRKGQKVLKNALATNHTLGAFFCSHADTRLKRLELSCVTNANIERAMCFSQWHITAEATMLPLSRCLTLTLLLSAAAGILGQDPMQQWDQLGTNWRPPRPPLLPINLCTGSKPGTGFTK
jgi:hypothetical protein